MPDSTVQRSTNGDQPAPRSAPGWAVSLEFLGILALLTLFAGQWPPDVNEAHYLAKAKHGWNPSWCPGDLFLDSSYSHWLFYLISGWWHAGLTLPQVAWVGRGLTWCLIALSWLQLGRSVHDRWGFSLVSAALFLVFNDQFHLAGEWVVGGFEAKGLAYAAVLSALAGAVRGRWVWVWPCLGLATALHVLVGGWATVALLPVAWQACRNPSRESPWLLPSLAIGLALALIGVVPPLWAEWGTDPVIKQQAHVIYVQERIAHHLTFDGFATLHVARFTLLLLTLWGLWRVLKPPSAAALRWRRLAGWALGSLVLSWVGLWLSGISEVSPALETWCAQWLRFYWFRLADMAIPLSLAIGLTVLAYRAVPGVDAAGPRWARLAVLGLCGWLAVIVVQRHTDPRPRADRQSLPSYPESHQRTLDTFSNWKKVCSWIADNTSPTATFITPAEQQTFKWYAGRTEVFNWKDVPQDAVHLLEWQQRRLAIYDPQRRYTLGLLSYSDEQLRELGQRYQAHYLLVPQRQVDLMPEPTQLRQVYPTEPGQRSTYVLYELQTPPDP